MAKTTTKDWSNKEAAMLIRLWMRIESILLIAILMDRTPSSIQTRALRLELPSRELDDSFRRRWTKEEDQELVSIFEKGNIDIQKLSVEKRRTVDAMISRLMTRHGYKLRDIEKKLVLPDAESIYQEGKIKTSGLAQERTCPKCMRPFWSTGFGHRICLSCKSSEDWLDGDI